MGADKCRDPKRSLVPEERIWICTVDKLSRARSARHENEETNMRRAPSSHQSLHQPQRPFRPDCSYLNLGFSLVTTPISSSLALKSKDRTEDRHVIANWKERKVAIGLSLFGSNCSGSEATEVACGVTFIQDRTLLGVYSRHDHTCREQRRERRGGG
ncbi:hypothetical protein FQN60_004612 [Etheostoma spectabile]|uniref:Uncharacterized protein n=1 Tax=Etheostoma spectabile TaxID=54343 RepID=A0A5J5DKL4_9PERO|nr:hypothetical protein FQN60_004612 [Etheostoma spectabile]